MVAETIFPLDLNLLKDITFNQGLSSLPLTLLLFYYMPFKTPYRYFVIIIINIKMRIIYIEWPIQ